METPTKKSKNEKLFKIGNWSLTVPKCEKKQKPDETTKTKPEKLVNFGGWKLSVNSKNIPKEESVPKLKKTKKIGNNINMDTGGL